MDWEQAQQHDLANYTNKDCNALVTDFDDTLTVCFDRREVFGSLFMRHGGNGVDAMERRLFNTVIRGKRAFVDVGANIGFFTLLAAKHMGDSATVIAVEPADANFRYLMANILLNRFEARVRAAKCALAEVPGTGVLNVAPVGFQVGNSMRISEPDWSTQAVTLQTLDSLCDQYEIHRLDLLKLDAEGYELRILQGAAHTLRHNRGTLCIICELNTRIHSYDELDALIAALKSAGGRIFTFDDSRREVVSHLDLHTPVTNVIAV